MNNILDTKKEQKSNLLVKQKLANTIILFLPLILLILTFAQLSLASGTFDSPLIPSFVIVEVNAGIINITICALAALIPCIYLRYKKHYLISSCLMLMVIIIIFIFRYALDLEEYFWFLGDLF